MPAQGLNGLGVLAAAAEDPAKTAMLRRIEGALTAMTTALVSSGFSEYEASEINLNTRFAITDTIRKRTRRSA